MTTHCRPLFFHDYCDCLKAEEVGGHLVEGEAVEVFVAEDHVLGGNVPVDGQCWVVIAQGGLALGGIEIVHFVLELGYITQHDETVGEATGNE